MNGTGIYRPDTRFGAWRPAQPAQQATSQLAEKPTQLPLEKPPPSDPKPRVVVRNFRNLALAAAGLFAFVQIPGLIQNFDQWTRETANQQPDSVRENPTPNTAWDNAMYGVAKAHNFVLENQPLYWLEKYYQILFEFEILYQSLLLTRAAFRRNLKPGAIYESLHKQGFTGKGLKVGMVTSGVTTVSSIPEKRLKLFESTLPKGDNRDPNKPRSPNDSGGRGTAEASIIAQAVPDCEIIAVKERSGWVNRKMVMSLYEAINNPDLSMIEKTRRLYQPVVDEVAWGLKKSIDEGAQVVVVTTSLDPSEHFKTLKSIFMRFFFGQNPIIRKLDKFDYKPPPITLAYPHRLFFFMKFLVFNMAQMHEQVAMNEGLDDLLKPWKDALDYAQSKGIPVVISAGQGGARLQSKPNALGNMNLLALPSHPATIIVGSANSMRWVSAFSSELNRRVNVDIAANGSGQLSAEGKINYGPEHYFRYPIFGPRIPQLVESPMVLQNPYGTSYACADVAANILMMKQFYKDITTDEIKDIMAKTAAPAKKGYHPLDWMNHLQLLLIEKSRLMDPINTRRFLEVLEAELLSEFKDNAKAAFLVQSVKELYVDKKNAPDKIHLASYDPREVVELTPEENHKAFLALKRTMEKFVLETHPEAVQNQLILTDRLSRQAGPGVLQRLAAVEEAKKRAEAKKQNT